MNPWQPITITPKTLRSLDYLNLGNSNTKKQSKIPKHLDYLDLSRNDDIPKATPIQIATPVISTGRNYSPIAVYEEIHSPITSPLPSNSHPNTTPTQPPSFSNQPPSQIDRPRPRRLTHRDHSLTPLRDNIAIANQPRFFYTDSSGNRLSREEYTRQTRDMLRFIDEQTSPQCTIM